jgi:hypothetical protein
MESFTPPRALLEAALPAADRTDWQKTKDAYLAVCKRVSDASGPYNEAERALYADGETAPTTTIAYTDPGFTSGAVTLQPRSATMGLTKESYQRDRVLACVGDHSEYLAFCQAVAEWQSRPERASLAERAALTEAEWKDAINAQSDLWHATAAFPLANTVLIAEKVDLLRSEAAGDGGWLTTLVDGIAADLARVNGRV